MPTDPKLKPVVTKLEKAYAISIVDPVPDPLCKVCEGSGKRPETEPPDECSCLIHRRQRCELAQKQIMALLLNNLARIIRALKD